VKCYCCAETYERGHWRCCGPPPGMPSEVWFAQWHDACPTAIVDGGQRVCPRHCRCERLDGSGQPPLPRPAHFTREAVDELVRELRSARPAEWLPYRDD
jgi:hypothetical protein